MSHPRTSIALALGLAVVCAVAWTSAAAPRMGMLLGYLLGAALCALGAAWQSHWLRVSPRRVLAAQVESFLAKLVALLVFALIFRQVESLAVKVDWRAFVVAFGAAVAILLPLSTYETMRQSESASALARRTAQ